MLEMMKLAVLGAKRNGRHVGICGEAPANYPEIARYLPSSALIRSASILQDSRYAVVTSGAQGIGRAIVERFLGVFDISGGRATY